ncbi:fusion of conjugal transfer pilus assembly proteins TraB and TraH [Escherichia coli]|nr:fusion of conjugal transfer pilus assembly proteins TraB and TraH [Escherichia coli]
MTAAQMQKQYEEIRRELDVLNKQRGDDQRRIEKLGQDNAALAEQVKALGANPVTATGEPVPQMPASPPGPEGEPQPGNTPVSFPPQGSVAVPPPTAFYPGNGVTPPPQVTYQSVPVPNRIQRKVFTRNEGKQGPSLPYIPSGSFAKAMLIEGADANASVTGNESTVADAACVSPAWWKCRNSRRMTQRDVLWVWKPGGMCPVSVPLYAPAISVA